MYSICTIEVSYGESQPVQTVARAEALHARQVRHALRHLVVVGLRVRHVVIVVVVVVVIVGVVWESSSSDCGSATQGRLYSETTWAAAPDAVRWLAVGPGRREQHTHARTHARTHTHTQTHTSYTLTILHFRHFYMGFYYYVYYI